MKKAFINMLMIQLILFTAVAFAEDCVKESRLIRTWQRYGVKEGSSQDEVIQALKSGEIPLEQIVQKENKPPILMDFLEERKLRSIFTVILPEATGYVEMIGTWALDCFQLTFQMESLGEIDMSLNDDAKLPTDASKQEAEDALETKQRERFQEHPIFNISQQEEVLFSGENVVLTYNKSSGKLMLYKAITTSSDQVIKEGNTLFFPSTENQLCSITFPDNWRAEMPDENYLAAAPEDSSVFFGLWVIGGNENVEVFLDWLHKEFFTKVLTGIEFGEPKIQEKNDLQFNEIEGTGQDKETGERHLIGISMFTPDDGQTFCAYTVFGPLDNIKEHIKEIVTIQSSITR